MGSGLKDDDREVEKKKERDGAGKKEEWVEV